MANVCRNAWACTWNPVRFWSRSIIDLIPEFSYGPLQGSLTEFAEAMWPGEKPDIRRLVAKWNNKRIWGTGPSKARECSVWFREESVYHEVKTELERIRRDKKKPPLPSKPSTRRRKRKDTRDGSGTAE